MLAQILVRCPDPGCQRTGRVPESYRGQQVRCLACKRKFSVSAAALPSSAPEAASEAVVTLAPAQAEATGWWQRPESLAPEAPPPGGLPTHVGRFQVRALLGSG